MTENTLSDITVKYYRGDEEYEEAIEDADRAIAEVVCPRCGTENTVQKVFNTLQAEQCTVCEYVLFQESDSGILSTYSGCSPSEFRDEMRQLKTKREVRLKGRNASPKDIALAGSSIGIWVAYYVTVITPLFATLFYLDSLIKLSMNDSSLNLPVIFGFFTGYYLFLWAIDYLFNYANHRILSRLTDKDDPNEKLAFEFLFGFLNRVAPLSGNYK